VYFVFPALGVVYFDLKHDFNHLTRLISREDFLNFVYSSITILLKKSSILSVRHGFSI
jgi:hypothetical protein